MAKIPRILIVDDSEIDAVLLEKALRKDGLAVETKRVDTAAAMREALIYDQWALVISDCRMPQFSADEALKIWKEHAGDKPFIVVSGAIGEEEAVSLLKAGAQDFIMKDNLARLVPAVERELREAEERRIHRLGEESLRKSEEQRLRLHAELDCAAQVQKQFLPKNLPTTAGFEFAARCLPATEVGGDFYDWYEMVPGTVTLTFGDVMGKGMAAAMLMATVRAALRAGSQSDPPAAAIHRAEIALRQDLDMSESFVTLFHGKLDTATRSLTFVDCGHGFDFMRRANGRVEELQPRGLPVGILPAEKYVEGSITFGEGDALILYSDGLIDALPETDLNNGVLAEYLDGTENAEEMLDRLASLVPLEMVRPDDLTLLVVRCQENS
jgi:sigma-B regulation protein RsbU (phosphoserine phosphatase)